MKGHVASVWLPLSQDAHLRNPAAMWSGSPGHLEKPVTGVPIHSLSSEVVLGRTRRGERRLGVGGRWRSPEITPSVLTSQLEMSLLCSLLLLLLSCFCHVRLCATPETAAQQAPPSLGFSRQEPWSGLPFPSPMHESEE